MTKPIEELLNISDAMQNELLVLTKKVLAREQLSAAEQALLEKIQSVSKQLHQQSKP